MTDTIRLDTLRLNDGSYGLPKNPRFIRDERFRALCRSIDDNPEYMPARPIIVNEAGVILGGNMRYRACLENGLVEVPTSWVQRVEGWPVDKQKRFVILDNRGFGEDDMDALANEWDVEDLIAAGFAEVELTGLADDTGDVGKEKDPAPPSVSISFPPRVWLVQASDIRAAIQNTVEPFGGACEWPD